MNFSSTCIALGLLATAFTVCRAASAAEYQWSCPIAPATTQPSETPRAYLWIPPDCRQVRAVVVGQHNMLEEDILEHPEFRAAMAKLGIAEIWITPALDGPFDPAKSGERFDAMLHALADISGYGELAFAPIAPIGHSAAASYPWNFAAWAPQRTLCALSIHGDAPQTPLAGFGRPNASWGDRNIDGVPGLMVMAEYEWIDARLAPATVYHVAHPKAPIAMLAEPGDGHFDACDDLVRYLVMFLSKCVEQRLPALAETPLDRPPVLKAIDPSAGWYVQRWTPVVGRTIPPGPVQRYGGDGVDAFWAFDEEMAQATQNYHADQIGKRPQLIGFVQNGQLVPATRTHEMVHLKFLPEADGETFKLQTRFLDTVTSMDPQNDGAGKNNHVRWTGLPAGSPLGHASGGGPIQLHRIEGPIEQIDADTFRLSFYRGCTSRQAIWVYATHPGDEHYKSAVQQASMPVPHNTGGDEQTITFPAIADQQTSATTVTLAATSSAGLPVHYYIREGPAEVRGDALKLLPIPPRAKYPIAITVVAWQNGRSGESRVKTAQMVERTFQITR
ncbi:MAG TPA: hypothetical protein VLI90_16025 [Tepidisphaeraceae bacterium]|nr:hypothetical protein [Tepidisphaeraceae bacterium]